MFDAFYNAMHAIGYDHSVHSTQVHMPIALVTAAFTFGILAFLLIRWPQLEAGTRWPWRASAFAAGARLCMVLSFLSWFPTIGSAIMDWQYFFAGAWLFPIKVKVGLSGFLFILSVAAIVAGYRTQGMPVLLLGIYTIAFFSVIALGFFGGQVSEGKRVPEASKQYQAGEYVFRSNCVGCHPGGANNLQPTMVIWGSPMLGRSAAFVPFLRHSPPPMPPFPPAVISDAQLKELYQYLHAVMGR